MAVSVHCSSALAYSTVSFVAFSLYTSDNNSRTLAACSSFLTLSELVADAFADAAACIDEPTGRSRGFGSPGGADEVGVGAAEVEDSFADFAFFFKGSGLR
jgi:hypothetical protein